MTSNGYDIFIAGGAYHFARLRALLPLLAPYGRVHLASITLNQGEKDALRPYCYRIHTPAYDPDGYRNFNLYCTRDINRLAESEYFIKLDADVELDAGWIRYLDDYIQQFPDIVQFGPAAHPLTVSLVGPKVEQLLGKAVRLDRVQKLVGSFYVGKTSFFKRHDAKMQALHELTFQSDDTAGFQADGQLDGIRTVCAEDVVRSIIVHLYGGCQSMAVVPSQGLIRPLPSPPRLPVPR